MAKTELTKALLANSYDSDTLSICVRAFDKWSPLLSWSETYCGPRLIDAPPGYIAIRRYGAYLLRAITFR